MLEPKSLFTQVKGMGMALDWIEVHLFRVTFRNNLQEAVPGDYIAFSIKSIKVKDIRRGMVVGHADNTAPRQEYSLIAQITVVNPDEIRAG